jgi:hypothetical protein
LLLSFSLQHTFILVLRREKLPHAKDSVAFLYQYVLEGEGTCTADRSKPGSGTQRGSETSHSETSAPAWSSKSRKWDWTFLERSLCCFYSLQGESQGVANPHPEGSWSSLRGGKLCRSLMHLGLGDRIDHLNQVWSRGWKLQLDLLHMVSTW